MPACEVKGPRGNRRFLSAYDPQLRKDSGAYYTPVEVVKCQVALVRRLLRDELGKAGGFAHKDVITLDPAVGTGTYLLGVIEQALSNVAAEQGPGMVKARATTLAGNLFGFEMMVGPYAVSELRLTRALKERGATIGEDGLGVYLADTLESPFGHPPGFPAFLAPLAEQHKKALQVKDKKSVIVCLGNPPYDRHAAVGENTRDNRARTGGWVRWGDGGKGEHGILDAFVKPAIEAGHGGDVKNLYNLYVYFWRWALWKVFEHTSATGGGVVSFITAASYLRGDAFVGVRELLRRLCHDVWIIDLGGEGLGTRQDDNVFNITTPVAIGIALRNGPKDRNEPATVRYACIRGTREEKYAQLAAVTSFTRLAWKTCPTDWHAPLRPKGVGPYFAYPKLTDLMPWQTSGAQMKRSWLIAPDDDTLRKRWRALLLAENRAKALVETRDRKITGAYPVLPGVVAASHANTPVSRLTARDACPPLAGYAFRSFDRQRLIADNRVGDFMRFPLWRAHSDRQLYFASLSTNALSTGPALTSAAAIPDLHYFRGSFGAKDVFPLYRDAEAQDPNILPGLLALWAKRLGRAISPEEFAAYVYALLAHPGFVDQFYAELEDREVRVPLTLDAGLFGRAVAAGQKLLFLHTFGERFTSRERRKGEVPRGAARCTEAISDEPADYPDHYECVESGKTLRVGTGAIAPVAPEVWDYGVSGFRAVDSWLGYRMKVRKGKKTSPLDLIHPERWRAEFTEELLRLLWILEHTIGMHADLADLLAEVCAGPLLSVADLPAVPEGRRKRPRVGEGGGLFDTDDDEDDEEQGEE
jgi:predicted helicase